MGATVGLVVRLLFEGRVMLEAGAPVSFLGCIMILLAPPGGVVFSGLIVPGGLGGWAVPRLGFIRLLCIDVVLVGVDFVLLGGVG